MHTLEQLKSGQLKGIKRLKIASGLTDFPAEILELADSLEILDLTGNHLIQLPDDLVKLKKLRIAFFSENDFDHFPPVLAQCPHLEMIGFKANRISFIAEDAIPAQVRWLILTNNQIEYLPKSIGKCHRLQKCMLAGNKLTELPTEMAACRNLQLLRISANQLETLPRWLFSLPHLSWLAFSGNPCCPLQQTDNTLQELDWADFELDTRLGEGASGVIYKAHWRHADVDKNAAQVAIKIFKGEVTSDGSPADELNACIAAGTHPNFVQVLGKICNHPEQKQGLVLNLIPPSFKNLGGPPSFETCTRDTYPGGTSFSLTAALAIAAGVAAAAAHLHTQNVMHGDLYAHNVLINEQAYPILGDFGAATSYGNSITAWAPALERIEVRAFGYLLDDLLTHLAPADTDQATCLALVQLKEACLQEDVLQRPGFRQIAEKLEQAAKMHRQATAVTDGYQ
ncbi:leucine-rich repeat-containing protein kinase family protein [Pontibacter beigongshangensis]|uniref:leucine-rich repeat-containing protein kinase family protein n=1 Tax=Pontibacter beigongshangensis TaxID=2574733 RepID=UPI00164F2A9E|nr:leucine-rich repeat-containing protein kinase family protein [Pontibacter beigongshangensis]